MKKILITGASGFIGNYLCDKLSATGNIVYGAFRQIKCNLKNSKFHKITVGDIDSKTNWKKALKSVDYVIHCASVAHEFNYKKKNNYYYSVNVDGTKRLAEQAAQAGIKRLIFLSTIKVNGENTDIKNQPNAFFYNDIPQPKDIYSKTKFLAEKVLRETSNETKLEIVVLRLPLVYGPNPKGNILRLIKLINLGFPLPFSLINNKRSLIGIDNLTDVLSCCLDHPEAKGKTFLVSDGEDISTPKLVAYMASAMGRSIGFFSIPVFLLKFFSCVLGKKYEIKRLTDSLQVDIEYTIKTLNWMPRVNVYDSIKRMMNKK